MRIEKLSIDDLTPELVDHFLQWLRIERNNGTATRSQRLAAIRSFVKYLQIKEPRLLLNFQQILAIPVKRAERKAIKSVDKRGDCADPAPAGYIHSQRQKRCHDPVFSL